VGLKHFIEERTYRTDFRFQSNHSGIETRFSLSGDPCPGHLSIEPQWDWNSVWSSSKTASRALSIEPQWDWNRCSSYIPITFPSAFNRTTVGLKLSWCLVFPRCQMPFNRTTVGLKQAQQVLACLPALAFNRTTVGLKPLTSVYYSVASFNFQSNHSGIETKFFLFLLFLKFFFQSNHSGIETRC